MAFRKKKKAIKTFADMTPAERQTQIEKLAYLFERMRLGDYVNNFNRPGRVFLMNMLGGIGRGVGLTIGATLVIAVIFKIISAMISWNVPYLSDMMKEAKHILEMRYAGDKGRRAESGVIRPGQEIEIKLPERMNMDSEQKGQ